MWFFWGWGQHFVLYRGFFCLRRWGGGFDFEVQVVWSRWYACCDLAMYALPVGALDFAMASALCLRASSVAPVRGGTYFALPPQRKVGKRKRLTPPARVLIHGP